MKKIKTLLALGMLGVMLTAMPAKGRNATTMTVNATYNAESGIRNAELTATLDDGSILGFYCNWYDEVYFCGAISKSTNMTIPDSVVYDSYTYAVKSIGYDGCDFDNAKSVTSLTLPATTPCIYNIPSTVKILHTKDYIDCFNVDPISNLTKIFVPENTLADYFENAYWSNNVLIHAEGAEPLKITINMTKPGEFAQLLLQKIDNWYKVNELAVVGEMNTDDLNVIKRMKQLTKIDLSKAIIADIPDNFSNANNYYEDGLNILEEIILPEINSIGDRAFSYCRRLKSITMPKVNNIGYEAFSNCGLNQIALPEGITTIGESAFSYSALESITIPSSIIEISDYCFSDCANLKSATIPQTITRIGYSAFHATALTEISLPGVQTISCYAFMNCIKLKEVKFAEGLVSIDTEAFSNCPSLTEIDLPSTLLSLNNGSFGYCPNLKKVISRATTPPTNNGNNAVIADCDMTDVKLYVPAMSIDAYRAEGGWKSFYTILPMEDKVANAFIYDNATIDDVSLFTTDCDMTLTWIYQYRNGLYQDFIGTLDYTGNSTLSLGNYSQSHYLGGYYYDNEYVQDAIFTSLITNGSMRADNVKTTLKTEDTYIWYFISLPYDVKVSDISYPEGTQFAIRKYSGLNRAQMDGDTWVNLTADDVMNAYEGYILRCNKDYAEFTFPAINNGNKNNIFEKESVLMPLSEYLSEFDHNRSWNLVGNPYPCYYDTRRMDFTAPITVWNRYYERYDAYSPIDDSYILHPAQAFFVQRPVDQASITFDKAGRQKDYTVQALQARAVSKSERLIYNIILSDGKGKDRTRVVMNNEAARTYELDKDASKFIDSNNTAMLVYTIEGGVKYAINERPTEDGTVSIGFFAPTEGMYTLSLNTLQKEDVTLIDHETNTKTLLTNDYHFNANAGFNDSRFTLKFGTPTGIRTIDNEDVQISVFDDSISADAPYSVYTMDGRLMGNYGAGHTAVLPKGIYIIGNKDVKRKIVVK